MPSVRTFTTLLPSLHLRPAALSTLLPLLSCLLQSYLQAVLWVVVIFSRRGLWLLPVAWVETSSKGWRERVWKAVIAGVCCYLALGESWESLWAIVAVGVAAVADYTREQTEKIKGKTRFIDLDTIPSPVVCYQDAVWTCNPAASALLQAASEQAATALFPTITLFDSPIGFERLTDALKAGKSAAYMRQNIGKSEQNGLKLSWEMSSNGANWACFCPLDITQAELYRSQAQVEASSQSALARSFSHEVYTPLNTILYIAEELQSQDSPDYQVQLRLLSANCTLLHMVLNDIIEYANIMAGHCEVVKAEFYLRPCLRKIIELFAYQIEQKGLALSISIDPYVPARVYSDERKLEQVFMNLLSNAVKYTLKGSISILISLLDNGQMRICISDTGVGLTVCELETLCRLHLHDAAKGAGMGLFVSTVVARKLGSERVFVQSEAGRGATFWVDVDVGEKGMGEYSPTSYGGLGEHLGIPLPLVTASRPMYLLGLAQRKCADVLIVDDNEFNRTILRMMLGKLGITCEEASTGLQAVNAVTKYRRSTFKLVIMDVEMPEMDGIEATKQIICKHLQGEISIIPQIIALTAYPASQLREKCLTAGMKDFLSKPIAMEKLQQVVGRYCGSRRGRLATI